MDQSDGMELAIARVHKAMDRVIAAWAANHPDLPIPAPEPPAPAWHPDPNQHPVTTRQWAEVTRMRAVALGQERRQIYQQAKQVHQATLELQGLPATPGRAGRSSPLHPRRRCHLRAIHRAAPP